MKQDTEHIKKREEPIIYRDEIPKRDRKEFGLIYPVQTRNNQKFYLYFDGQSRSIMPDENDFIIINNGSYMYVDCACAYDDKFLPERMLQNFKTSY